MQRHAGTVSCSPRTGVNSGSAVDTIKNYTPNYLTAEVIGWLGVFSAGQTLPEIVAALNSTIAAIMKEPDVHGRIVTQGGEPLWGPSADLRDLLAREIDVWGKVIRDAGINPG